MSPLLIASGDYVNADIAAEVGRLPPAFLPVGCRRLYELQLSMVARSDRRFILTLPEGFEPDPFDARLLAEAGVEIIRSDPGLSLGASIVNAIRSADLCEGPIQILHGDTLYRGLDSSAEDHVTIGETSDYYRWARFEMEAGRIVAITDDDGFAAGSRQVLSGWFHLADAGLLVSEIERTGGFVTGLDGYTRRRPLEPLAAGEWLDFGHVNTFYQSRGRFPTERDFNALSISRRTVAKRSAQRAKMAAEVAWYRSLPPALKPRAPILVDADLEADLPGYSLEHLYLAPLSDLYVFGRLPRLSWREIFRACDEFITTCRSYPAPSGEVGKASAILREKTQQRLAGFATASRFDIGRSIRINGVWAPSLSEMVAIVAHSVPSARPELVCFVHGDMSFSNLLYDFRRRMIRVVDPRGLNGLGEPSVFGDIRYDIAKLWQCAVGGYDLILAGRYDIQGTSPYDLELALPFDERLANIRDEFLCSRFGGMTSDEASAPAIAVLLFISMLPLHADDPRRQRALLANAARLYAQLERVEP